VCRNAACTRRIFTERLPDLIATYARKTHRLITVLRAIGLAVGGQAVAWLAQHPTITVVCRDRSDLYADGIRRGGPQAVQAVDRFHLVRNLRKAVEAFLVTKRPMLQVAAVRTAQILASPVAPVPATRMYAGKRQCS
jgi:Transposase